MLQEQEIKWEEFYKTPLWRKWDDKQSGIDNGYEAMHVLHDFESPKVLKMLQMIASGHPMMHAYHTPMIHEMMGKVNIIIIIIIIIIYLFIFSESDGAFLVQFFLEGGRIT